ncbi:Zinc/iron permease [Moelleriella libera RCEF 2490]|uniref:Zinc/iron permease n=1 Tax=Moelleriella libera RCEF 2490 TaxID=1081109 RepID=A0A167Z417_9HYPO|nr:Zinc/iron permease [Moelleriella libera RCEF 2490]
MHLRGLAGIALLGVATADIYARQTPAPSSTAAAAPKITAITGCHLHGASQLYCMAGSSEYLVKTTPTQTTDIPAQFTGCHNHGPDTYCLGPNGDDVQVQVPASEGGNSGTGSGSGSGSGSGTGSGNGHKHCHFHAGVEHCVSEGEGEGGSSQPSCDAPQRDYNIGLRVGLLFVIMATSALGVFGPIFLQKVLPNKLNVVFIVLKQFGTGIIISTAFVHLFTHASLMFGNKCLGDLGYEATTAAILMAGIFLSFVVEYIGQRIVLAKTRNAVSLNPEEQADALLRTEVVSILVMEAGILFHSLLIGLTLVVAGDSFFITLFVVILFHQIFEGLALGTRIASVGQNARALHASHTGPGSLQDPANDVHKAAGSPVIENPPVFREPPSLSMKKKLGLASLFAFVTPLGMAIGIGVLHKFNGNDKSTIIAIGTLDALSAGILVWTGVVEMWAADWVTGAHGHSAELADAPLPTVLLAGAGLMTGMAVMSLLGKWA